MFMLRRVVNTPVGYSEEMLRKQYKSKKAVTKNCEKAVFLDNLGRVSRRYVGVDLRCIITLDVNSTSLACGRT